VRLDGYCASRAAGPELRIRTILDGVEVIIEEHAPAFIVLKKEWVGAVAPQAAVTPPRREQ
jgi:hypothetical protein